MPTDVQTISLITALMPFLVAGAVALLNLLSSKLPAPKQAMVMKVAQMAVQATEQMGAAQGAQAKKVMASEIAVSSLSSMGIKVNPSFVSAAIESFVLALNSTPVVTTAVAEVSTSTTPVVPVAVKPVPTDGSANQG